MYCRWMIETVLVRILEGVLISCEDGTHMMEPNFKQRGKSQIYAYCTIDRFSHYGKADLVINDISASYLLTCIFLSYWQHFSCSSFKLLQSLLVFRSCRDLWCSPVIVQKERDEWLGLCPRTRGWSTRSESWPLTPSQSELLGSPLSSSVTVVQFKFGEEASVLFLGGAEYKGPSFPFLDGAFCFCSGILTLNFFFFNEELLFFQRSFESQNWGEVQRLPVYPQPLHVHSLYQHHHRSGAPVTLKSHPDTLLPPNL